MKRVVEQYFDLSSTARVFETTGQQLNCFSISRTYFDMLMTQRFIIGHGVKLLKLECFCVDVLEFHKRLVQSHFYVVPKARNAYCITYSIYITIKVESTHKIMQQ